MSAPLQQRLADARTRALSPDDSVSDRAELEIYYLQALDELLRRRGGEEALRMALLLVRSCLHPAEMLRRVQAWASEREAEGGTERPYTVAENQLLTVARVLRGEP
jgi:hypothetical protein